MRRRAAGAMLVAVALTVGAPASASAESALWTLVASPLAATTGVETTFTLTATNEDPLAALLSSSEIGCVVVNVPVNFSIASVAVTGSNAGGSWFAGRTGNQVIVQAGSGGDRLELMQWVRFTVRATALSTGSLTWDSRAYRDQDCGGSGSLLGVPPIVVVTGPAVTPTPTPTTSPTPAPTSAPTPSPTPTTAPILPLPTPSLPLPSLPLPSLLPSEPLPSIGVTPTPSPGATSPPAPSASPSSGPSGGAPTPTPTSSAAAGASAGSGGSGGPQSPSSGGSTGPGIGDPEAGLGSIRFDERRLDLVGTSVGLFAGIEIWAVPAATIALPGLLVLVWVALQTAGAIAWMPAVRRLRGEDRRPRRPRYRTPPS